MSALVLVCSLPRGIVRLISAVSVAVLAFAVPATAQTTPAPQAQPGPFDGVLETFGLKAKHTRAPDFVRRSRPDESAMHYLPTGAPPDGRNDRPLTPAEVSALTSQLDSTRMEQQRRAGLKPAPLPQKTEGAGQAGKSILR